MLKIDPTTGKIVSRIPLPAQASFMTGDASDLWVLTHTSGGGGTVVHIDPVTGRIVGVVPLPAGAYAGPAAFWDGNLWVAANIVRPGRVWSAGRRELLRIDPTANVVAGAIATPVCTNYDGHCAPGRTMQVADGALWVRGTKPGTLVRVDPSTRSLSYVDTETSEVAIGNGSVWSAVPISGAKPWSRPTALVRNDETTGARTGDPIPLTGGRPDPIRLAGSPFAVDDGYLWLTGRDVGFNSVVVALFDIASGRIVSSVSAVRGEVFSNPVFDRATGSVWVVAPYSIVRVGPA